jgi:pilus assembly protein CpaE
VGLPIGVSLRRVRPEVDDTVIGRLSTCGDGGVRFALPDGSDGRDGVEFGAMSDIRIFIVDSHSPTVEFITRIIQFEADIRIEAVAGSAQEALQRLDDMDPEVVLIDLELPDGDGISTAAAILDKRPLAEVVLLSVDSDVTILKRAMNAGIRDMLIMPPSGDKLCSTIRKAYERHEKRKAVTGPLYLPQGPFPDAPVEMGHLIAVCSAKGGVGCTMLATNLALKLHTEHTPTLIIDGDLKFGDVALFLNLSARFSIADLAPYAEELEPDIIHDVLTTHISGLTVLAAPKTLEDADGITVDAMRKIVDYLLTRYTYVVVDTSTGFDNHAVAVIEMADVIVAVMAPEMSSIKNTSKLYGLLQEIGVPKERVCLVLNCVDRRDAITARQIAEHLKTEIAAEIPFDRQTVLISINKGDPLLQNGKTQPMAKNFLGLIRVIRDKLAAEPIEA